MIIIKKFYLIFFILLLSCGYEPIYSSKNINFSIVEIEKENTPLNNEFARTLKTFENENTLNKVKIKIESSKKVETKSKDSKGNPNVYELNMSLKMIVFEKNSNKVIQKQFSENINFNNQDDKFQLNQYQKELEELLINRIIDDVLKFLSNLK